MQRRFQTLIVMLTNHHRPALHDHAGRCTPIRWRVAASLAAMGREASDEAYVLRLCDQVLGDAGARQHRFDWLLGDPGKSGRCARLPVDGYWPNAKIVVEYRELQHDRPVAHFDKPDRLTVSGVHRGVQRAIYDARRDLLIPAHGIRLVVVTPAHLATDSRGRLRRDEARDLPAIRRLLSPPA